MWNITFHFGCRLCVSVHHSLTGKYYFPTCANHLSASICSTFGLDRDSVINQYITTVLLLHEDEEGAVDSGKGQEEMQPLCHADALERVLQIIPMLHSKSELTDSLCAAMFKVCARGTS